MRLHEPAPGLRAVINEYLDISSAVNRMMPRSLGSTVRLLHRWHWAHPVLAVFMHA